MERKGQKIPGPTCSILITAVRLYLALRTKYGQRSMLDLLLVLFRGCLQQSSGEGDGTPLQYSCLENPMDGGAWWAAVNGVVKSWTWLSNFPFTFHFHSLKEMATHSSVLACKIPGTGEPGGLPSMVSHRVGHDWSNLAAAAAEFNDLRQEKNTVILQQDFEPKTSSTYIIEVCSVPDVKTCCLLSGKF